MIGAMRQAGNAVKQAASKSAAEFTTKNPYFKGGLNSEAAKDFGTSAALTSLAMVPVAVMAKNAVDNAKSGEAICLNLPDIQLIFSK